MRQKIYCLLTCIILAATGQAQKTGAAKALRRPGPEQELARTILSSALEETKPAGPDVRAFVRWRVALNLDDKQQQRKVLEDAFLDTLQIPTNTYNLRLPLQQTIIYATFSQAGTAALEDIMPAADSVSRSTIRSLLISSYAESGNFDRAVVLLKGARDDATYPYEYYEAVKFLMASLPSDKASLRRTIFDQALAAASEKIWNVSRVAPLIGKFWRDLPKDQVLQVINTILEEARQRDACPCRGCPRPYEDYVGAFLPILRELDPAKAAFLVKEKARGGPPREECDYNKLGKFLNVDTTPATGKETTTLHPKPRLVFGCKLMAYCRIQKIEAVLRLIRKDLKFKRNAGARLAIEQGFAMAAEEWKYDTYPDDPNLSPRDIWPSTLNWEAFALLASYISPQYALDQVRKIPDAGIQLMARVVLAEYWLGDEPELRAPEIVNDEGMSCDCVDYDRYIPRHWHQSHSKGKAVDHSN